VARGPDLAGLLLAALATGWAAGAPEQKLEAALKLRRRAQFRADFVNAENSMGFHAPQEAARILAEAIDYARQGQLAVMSGR
jgi:nitrite reductase (cytochrome c-552)